MQDDRLSYYNPNESREIVYDAGPQEYNRYPKSASLNMAHELQRLGADPDVIILACDELARMDMKFRRGKKWLTAIFHCLDVAYRQLSIPVEPRTLADKIGISLKDVSKFEDNILCANMNIDMKISDNIMYCTGDCAESDQEDAPESCKCTTLGTHNIVFMDPCFYIEDYCSQTGLFDLERERHMVRMKRLCDIIKLYVDDYPQVLACGVIQFYCHVMGEEYPKDELIEISKKSQPPISKVSRMLRVMFER